MSDLEKKAEELKERVREVATELVAPRAADIDVQGDVPADLVEVFAEEGFLSIMLPEQYGGMNGSITCLCTVVEEIARVCGSSSLLVLCHAVGTMPVVVGGNIGQKRRWYESISREVKLAGIALTEPDSGSDAASIRTKATLQGDYYILNGRKCFITNGGIADFYSLFATTDPQQRIGGITAFVVEKDTEGFSIGKKENKMGMRGSSTTELILENAKVPRANLLGFEGRGWRIAMRTLNMSRPGIGAQAVGIAQGALDCTLEFARERIRFERPFTRYQGIQFMIADMDTQVEAARALVYKTASMLDEGVKGVSVEKFSSMSKYFPSDVAMKVTTEAVQIMEEHGLTRESPVERMMRDAKVTQIYEGTNQVQRLVVAHAIL
ncbi:MAG: acyl-CoA dehydrogenase [Proteobacteria bacterium]|nr:acyl-CoA dehydrogenase [Pseudomonadota bacterium]